MTFDDYEDDDDRESARAGEPLTPLRILENTFRLGVDIFDSLSAASCQLAEDLSASQADSRKRREEEKRRRLIADDIRSLERGES